MLCRFGVYEDEQKPAAPNRFIFNVLGRSQGGRAEHGGAGVAQSLDRDREIYEPVFIERIVLFIDVAEVGMEC